MNWRETALLFPGQGSQVVGMGKSIADSYPVANEIFEKTNDLLRTDFSALVWNGPEEDLNDTYNTQPALFITCYAIFRALNYELAQRGLPPAQPAYMAGHSLGELTALTAAGAMDFEHGLKLVRERGRLMREAGENSPGSMAAVIGMELEDLRHITDQASQDTGETVVIANDNCPGQVVISGSNTAVARAVELANEAGARMAVTLAVSIAAHSPLMTHVSREFANAVAATPMVMPNVPVVGNALNRELRHEAEIREELNAQLYSPVYWRGNIQLMQENGITNFVELGPKEVLVGLMKRIDRKSQRMAIETPEQLNAFVDSLMRSA